MNKRILYISLFLLLTASFGSRAQEYIPMLKEGNQWNILWKNPDLDFIRTEILQLGKTIILNGVEYIEVTSTDIYGSEIIRVEGYLREDIETQKVYLLGDKEAEEGLIYDFDVEIGDEIITILPGLYGLSYDMKTRSVVTCIDTLDINGEKRRCITVDAYNYWRKIHSDDWEVSGEPIPAIYVEGIGSIDGLFANMSFITTSYARWLLAFKQNGEVVYNPYNYAKDFYWDEAPSYVSIEQISDELPIHITLSSDQLFIRNEKEADYGIALYTTTGRLILTQQSGGREAVVPLSSLPAGVYFLRVYGEGGEVTKKIQVVK